MQKRTSESSIVLRNELLKIAREQMRWRKAFSAMTGKSEFQ